MTGSSFFPARLFEGLPRDAALACLHRGVRPSPVALGVDVARQRMLLFRRLAPGPTGPGRRGYRLEREYVVSTSRYGIGQSCGTNRTPLGLHRIACKIGGGWPPGTVFRSRVAVGSTREGQPNAPIAHRILWLDGLEPGFNRGRGVDSRARYIYIHGVGDGRGLGRPRSRGCIHLGMSDLFELFDRVDVGALVWIAERL